MAIPKVCGIETEYGIVVRGGGHQPDHGLVDARQRLCHRALGPRRLGLRRRVTGSSTPAATCTTAAWHRPGRHQPTTTPSSPTAPATTSTTPIRSTRRPSARTVLERVAHDEAGEVVLLRSMAAAKSHLPPGEEIVVYKNNSDGKGNSYGCHENYLVDRDRALRRHRRATSPPHLVTRQIFTGAGKVGCEERRAPIGPPSRSPSAPTSSRRRSASRRR